MTITERIVGDVAVIDINGRVTSGEGVENLRDKINSLLHQGYQKLLLNLNGVDYLDSAGLGEQVGAYRETVTKAIHQMKANGFIEVGRKRITILDKRALRESSEL